MADVIVQRTHISNTINANEYIFFLTDPQAAWRVLQYPEEGGGFGEVDSGEETFFASQQN